jgi:outer membrane receptor protein involved in Fe transport
VTPLLAVLILIGAVAAQAKVTGKISGVVLNSETGEPVVGATVTVVDTDLATKTDEDGEYFIINVPIGQFDLLVSHVGYERMVKKEVRVLVDLTTPVDFDITQAPVELANEVVVFATAPLIQKDLTASRVIFTEERLRNLPNINSVQSILTNYPGVVTDAGQDLHVRGGRDGELSYYYDGYSIQDPFFSSAGMRIVPTSLAELSLTSGGFTAEYGEALSGVVSAVTREGTSQYHGQMRTYQGATQPYDVIAGDWGDLTTVTNRSLTGSFAGPVPGLDSRRYNFFTAGEYLRDDGFLPHNWYTSYTGIGKLTMQPLPKFKLKTNITYHESDGANYDHRDVNNISYDFNLDGLPVWDRKAYIVGVTGNYALSDRAITSLTVNQFFTRTQTGPAHLKGMHWSDWPGYSEDENGIYNGTIHSNNYNGDIDYTDERQITGFTSGDDFNPTYAYRKTRYNSVSGSLVTQWNKNNQIKSGFEYRAYDLEWDFKQFYNSKPYGERYTSRPKQASFFAEDKLEYRDFVVNLGIRFDYRDADIAYNYTPEDTIAHYKDAESKSRYSPRLGVSFPISDKTAMHFNYGIYYQVPQFRYLYTNLSGDRTSGLPILGNPDLEPEETISYELGVDHLIGHDLRLDLTAYHKDISELVTTREVGAILSNPVTRYVNDDYGTVVGFDMSLEKLPLGGNLSGSISYGFMLAKGNGSDANEPYQTYLTSTTDTLPPLSEYYLDFDQRHTITAVVSYNAPKDWSGRLFGQKLPGAWGLSMVGYYGSGLPYSRVDASGNRMGERNGNRLPAVYTVDMRFNKDLAVGWNNSNLTFFIEVDNLFDRKNVLNVYTRTGLPDDDNRLVQADLSLDQEELNYYDRLYDLDPQNYSPPRTVRTGLEFSF